MISTETGFYFRVVKDEPPRAWIRIPGSFTLGCNENIVVTVTDFGVELLDILTFSSRYLIVP